MKNVILVLKEQYENFYLIRRLSFYELKSANNNNYLGIAWEFLNPLIQILIYWFVFGYGIRERADIQISDGRFVAFLPWMITGFILWLLFYQSTILGSKSIFVRLKMLSKMNFPMSIIPNIVMFSQLYIHFFMISLAVIVLFIFGYGLTIYFIQIFYFLFSTLVFSYAFALITSTLSTIIRDVHMFLNASLRLLLYVSPILWDLSGSDLSPWIHQIMRLNPLFYLIEGYRASFFGTSWYLIENMEYTIYFWGLTIIILFIGSKIHIKFRRHLVDFL
ncbi:teichoic acid transport system permease protein [Amphibacillus marinus]|uniref:Transport permease protein n=1 Tax=Amphibacillus marinus TaxID=872970 RepID=A0A1H8N4S3_9BACI|nr:ABC transporter permease [Amphibacillus marinus]SEO24607.1 teichoic acid transport system permease protein [Amphibacillus marinus]